MKVSAFWLLLLGITASADSPRAHTKERFTFRANAVMEQVAPLFGADKERVWSPGWNPRFVNPSPATDAPGMVFTIRHSELEATWVNTEFDLRNGRIQYVYIIPDALITVVTIRLTALADQTNVEVEYERTALTAEADAHVRHLAEEDRKAGRDWEAAINSYLAKLTQPRR